MENASQEDLRRIEGKVDKLTDAVMRLVLIEERQSTQGERIGRCENAVAGHDSAISHLDKTVHMWINRGVGAWAVAAVMFALVQFGSKWFK